MKYSGFIGPAYNLEDPIDRQDCINLYYERDELGTGKNGEQGRLLATPGFCRDGLDDKIWRQNGLFPASNGKVYGVSGNQVYVITDGASGLVATLMTQAGGAAFTLNTTSGYIDWADSGEYILFTHETGNTTGGLIQIRLSDDTVSTKTFETVYGTVARYPRTVEFNKGRFIVGVRQSSRGLWFYSDIVSVTPIPTFSALYFFTAESDPDTTTQIKAAGDYLWLGGTKR